MQDEIFDRPCWEYSCELYERSNQLADTANEIGDPYWKGRIMGQSQMCLQIANELLGITWRKIEK